MKRLLVLAFIIASLCSDVNSGTITKRLIGKQDIYKWDGVTNTFTVTTSTGRTMTMDKLDWPGVDVYGLYGERSGDAISRAMAAIGTSTKAALWLSPGTWTLSADLTITSNLSLVMPPGAVIELGAYDLTINGPFEAGLFQVFDDSGTGSVSFGAGAVEVVRPEWWGAAVDNTTDDHDAWESALNSLPSSGGVVQAPIGTSYVASTIVWPNDGTRTHPIVIRGSDPSAYSGAVTTITGGVSAIRFGGTGALFDMRNGTAADLNWIGAIEYMHLYGPGSSTSSYAIYLKDAKGARLENLFINEFGRAIFIKGYFYYSKIDRVFCKHNGWGLYGDVAGANGTKIERCNFSNSTNNGVYLSYGGYPVTFSECWFEGNGIYGLGLINPYQANIENCYFEGNVHEDLYVSGSGFYNSVVNVTGCHFEATSSHASVRLNEVYEFNAIGNNFEAYSGNKAIVFSEPFPRGVMIGNRWPKVAGVNPVTNSDLYNHFLWSDPRIASPRFGPDYPKYDTKIRLGDFFLNADTTLNGGYIGWVCSEPGAGSLAAAPSVTATTTSGSTTIAVDSISKLSPNMTIQIAGVTFGSSSKDYTRIVDVPSTSSIVVEDAPNSSTSGALTYNTAEFKPVFGLSYDRSVTADSTSTTSEEVLKTTQLPHSFMTSTSCIHVIAAGTKSGSAGDKKVKFYWGSTAIEVIPDANNTNDWRLDILVCNASATGTQNIIWTAFDGTNVTQGVDTGSEDTTGIVTVKITGRCVSASDSVTANLWLVEPR